MIQFLLQNYNNALDGNTQFLNIFILPKSRAAEKKIERPTTAANLYKTILFTYITIHCELFMWRFERKWHVLIIIMQCAKMFAFRECLLMDVACWKDNIYLSERRADSWLNVLFKNTLKLYIMLYVVNYICLFNCIFKIVYEYNI